MLIHLLHIKALQLFSALNELPPQINLTKFKAELPHTITTINKQTYLHGIKLLILIKRDMFLRLQLSVLLSLKKQVHLACNASAMVVSGAQELSISGSLVQMTTNTH